MTAEARMFNLYCTRLARPDIMPPVKYWEIIADQLSAAGS